MIKFCPTCKHMTDWIQDNLSRGDNYRCSNCFAQEKDPTKLPDSPRRREADVTAKNR